MHADYPYTPPLYNPALAPYLYGMGFSTPCLKEIVYAYLEPHRYFYDWARPNMLATQAIALWLSLPAGTVSDDHFRGFQLALIFCDIVFTPTQPDRVNKEASVECMVDILARYNIEPSPVTLQVAKDCIRRTANPWGLPDFENINLEAIETFRDLSITYLSAPYPEFERAIHGQELEWSTIASPEYVTAISRRYLTSIYSLPNIFNTPILYARYEAAARSNLHTYLNT